MKINLKDKCEAFAQMGEMLWESFDVILLVAQMELEQEGYIVSFQYTGRAKEAVSAALDEGDGKTVPTVYVFLPDARLIPPDPDTCLIIYLESYTNDEDEIMVKEVIISYENEDLKEHAEYIANVISTTIKP